MQYTLCLIGLASVVWASPISSDGVLAPLYGTPSALRDSYIVVFKNGEFATSQAGIDDHHDFVRRSHGAIADADMPDASTADAPIPESGLHHVYSLATEGIASAFHGYSLRNVSSSLLDQIRARPEVDYVEHDQLVWTQDNVPQDYEPDVSHMVIEKGAPWGLARISHRNSLSLGTFNKYLYDDRGGLGVDAYVIDTGIRIDHEDFEGRAHWGKTIPQGDADEDGNGHGTHCAGTIGGSKYGVAKAVQIYAVKVLRSNGSGSMSDVLAGVIWAAKAAAEKMKSGTIKGSVANLSLGGGKSRALDEAIDRAVESGLHIAVAAGNDNKDACDFSPAAAKKAVTVGASTLWDERATFSNFGSCVDILAPGLNIKSTWNSGPTATNTISGTSMASPHTCGYLAYLLSIHQGNRLSDSNSISNSLLRALPVSVAHPIPAVVYVLKRFVSPSWVAHVFDIPAVTAPVPGPISPAVLKNTLLELGTRGVLSNLDAETPNLLLFNNATRS